MKNFGKALWELFRVFAGCAIFGLGFSLFLEPCGLNAGGISGLSMLINHWTGFATIGSITALLNLPLFAIGGIKVGKKFFFSSLLGMFLSSTAIDLFAMLPIPTLEPLIAALYGGVLCGFGLGMVFSTGGSTGGSDILVRLLKFKWQNVPIGTINMCFDLTVAALTGLAYGDLARALYSGVAIFVCGKVMDAVIYRFDYSKVALIVTKHHEEVAKQVGIQLDRGATFLHGQGSYSGQETKVVLTAVKKQQVSDLKRLVVEIDPDAFIIVQEAHQVLGDGFARYSKFSL